MEMGRGVQRYTLRLKISRACKKKSCSWRNILDCLIMHEINTIERNIKARYCGFFETFRFLIIQNKKKFACGRGHRMGEGKAFNL